MKEEDGNQSSHGMDRNVKKMNHEIQIVCRQEKNEYFNRKFEEIEKLHDTHNPMMHKKIKEFKTNRKQNSQGIRNKDRELLDDEEEIRERWAQYVQELYQDNRQDTLDRIGVQDKYIITEEEVRSIGNSSSREKRV